MRGQIRGPGPGHGVPVSAAYRVSGPVPALLHDDPLFLGLCAAFDDLLGPVVTALDCFAAYLDPWLAPDDFVAWLATLVGADDGAAGPRPSRRSRGSRERGSAPGWPARCAATGPGVPPPGCATPSRPRPACPPTRSAWPSPAP